MSFEVREFKVSDYARARALWERTPGVGLSAADEEAPVLFYLRRNPGTSFVAVSTASDVLIGTVLCGHDGRRGLIHHLAVASEHRRCGIGRALVKAGLAGLREQGISKCHLMVFANNTEGLAFWARCGAQSRSELQLFSMPVQNVT